MANFSVQDICDEISNDREIQQLCMDLSAQFTEFNLPGYMIDDLKQKIIEELEAITKMKLESAVNKNEQHLKEQRVLKVRGDLEDWWTKCRFSDEQKSAFKPYFSQDYTDDLLLLHQEELRKLEHYHAANLPLFNAVDEYMEFYNRYLELDAEEKNPNRLFDNRGGQLLKEERDRKAARKNLPKLKNKISSLITVFERKYSMPFTLNGIILEEYFKLHSEKTREISDATGQLPSSSGSGLKRKTPDTPTASSGVKPATPTASSGVKPAKQPKRGIPVLTKSRKALHPSNK